MSYVSMKQIGEGQFKQNKGLPANNLRTLAMKGFASHQKTNIIKRNA